MLHVMIADDEQYEREYLQKILAEQYAGILEVVYMAADGADVLEKADQYHPEILLLDIRMPRLDGLETAAQLLRKYPDLQIIIVSAYDEFSYARQAMKLGIRDFLVKPYLDKELTETLDKVLATLGSLGRKPGQVSLPGEGTEPFALGELDKDIVWELALGRRTEAACWKELAIWGIQKCSFKCIVFCHSGILRLGTRGCDIIKGLFHMSQTHTVASYLLDQLVVYVFAEDPDIYVDLNRCIRKTRTYLQELGSGTVFCGVSGIYDGEASFRQAFEEASGYILEYADHRVHTRYEETIQDTARLCDMEDKAGFAIANCSEDQGCYWICQLLACLNRHYPPDGVRGQLCRHVMTIIRRLNRQLGVRITTAEVGRISDLFAQPDLPLEPLVGQILTLLTDNARGIQLNHNVAVVAFTRYLTHVRLDKAKELMRIGEKNIQEISYEVGFSDPNYFGKCFKKYEKISPTDYCAMQILGTGE